MHNFLLTIIVAEMTKMAEGPIAQLFIKLSGLEPRIIYTVCNRNINSFGKDII